MLFDRGGKIVSDADFICAVDIDGTMGEYHGQFIKFAQLYYDTKFPPAHGYDGSMELHEYMGLELTEYRIAKLAYRQGGWQRWMPTLHWAREATVEMRRLGIEIWVTTTRPYLRHDGIDPDTREWLERNGILWDYLLYSDDKYERFCERVEPGKVLAIVDDLPKNLVPARKQWEDTQLVLMERPHNRNDPLATDHRGYVVQDMWDFTQLIHAKIQGEEL